MKETSKHIAARRRARNGMRKRCRTLEDYIRRALWATRLGMDHEADEALRWADKEREYHRKSKDERRRSR